MEAKVILGVVGVRAYQDGRDFDDIALVEENMRRHFEWYDEVISGGAKRGADKLAIIIAKKHRVEYREFLPDLARFGSPVAYHQRNRLIAKECDKLLAFWDGKSRGTKSTIEFARGYGKDVEIIDIGA